MFIVPLPFVLRRERQQKHGNGRGQGQAKQQLEITARGSCAFKVLLVAAPLRGAHSDRSNQGAPATAVNRLFAVYPGVRRSGVRPNPSVKGTPYGSRRKPGPRWWNQFRSPGLRRLPSGAPYFQR